MGLFDWFKQPTTEKVEPTFGQVGTTENLNESFIHQGLDASQQNISAVLSSNFGSVQSAMHGNVLGQFGNFVSDGFFDTGGIFSTFKTNPTLFELERSYIFNQRVVSMYPEVAIGIDEIMRDLYNKDQPVELFGASEDAFNAFEEFKKTLFTPLQNLHQNSGLSTPQQLIVFNVLKQAYIDGQMCLAVLKLKKDSSLKPSESNLSEMLNESKALEAKEKSSGKSEESTVVFIPLDPTRLTVENAQMFDFSQEKQIRWRYALSMQGDVIGGSAGHVNSLKRGLTSNVGEVFFTDDQIIRADFGLFDKIGARHGFLFFCFKYANQLQALQDMLIPMRFRRSVARRVFNVDIAGIPQARATAYIEELRRKFKYKKHYDVNSGRIVSSQNEPVGIVEDYWFANRSGSKGTTVETIDEGGNFQDSLDDIQYFNKKLYQSMFLPLRRVFESEAEYDYTSSSIESDELRFQSFLTRIRSVFNAVLTQMFKEFAKCQNVEINENISVRLKFDDWLNETKEREQFESALGFWDDVKPYVGKLISAETALRKVFNMSPDDFKQEIEKIKVEMDEGNPMKLVHLAIGADLDSSDDY